MFYGILATVLGSSVMVALVQFAMQIIVLHFGDRKPNRNLTVLKMPAQVFLKAREHLGQSQEISNSR